MNPEQYKKFQDFQNQLFHFIESEIHADTVFGNEVFQRMSDAAFEVYEKYSKSEVINEG